MDHPVKMSDDWADAPQAPGELQARVWYCNDDCGCSEPQIVRINAHSQTGWTITLWTGTYRIEHELGADRELNREARRLRKHHRDLYRRIEWPWDRSRAERSWPDDNDTRAAKCCMCNLSFAGHRARTVCRTCATKLRNPVTINLNGRAMAIHPSDVITTVAR